MKAVHSIGVFHSVADEWSTHCAFTQKTRRLPAILEQTGLFGDRIYCYNNIPFEWVYGPFEPALQIEEVEILSRYNYDKAVAKTVKDGNLDLNRIGSLAQVDTYLWKAFDTKLKAEMFMRVNPGDVILHNFGMAHQGLVELFPDCIHIEPGIGYPNPFAPYKIYESAAWMAHCIGTQNRQPEYGEFVVPHHFDETYWKCIEGSERPIDVLYLGRVVREKGMDVIGAISQERPDWNIVVSGSGDREYIKQLKKAYPNVEYRMATLGEDRVKLYNSAKVSILPTQYFEPFGGAIIEAAMCGCGIVTSDFGCFPETLNVLDGIQFRARTLKDYLRAIEDLMTMNEAERFWSSNSALDSYGMKPSVQRFKAVFERIMNLHEYGWRGMP